MEKRPFDVAQIARDWTDRDMRVAAAVFAVLEAEKVITADVQITPERLARIVLVLATYERDMNGGSDGA